MKHRANPSNSIQPLAHGQCHNYPSTFGWGGGTQEKGMSGPLIGGDDHPHRYTSAQPPHKVLDCRDLDRSLLGFSILTDRASLPRQPLRRSKSWRTPPPVEPGVNQIVNGGAVRAGKKAADWPPARSWLDPAPPPNPRGMGVLGRTRSPASPPHSVWRGRWSAYSAAMERCSAGCCHG